MSIRWILFTSFWSLSAPRCAPHLPSIIRSRRRWRWRWLMPLLIIMCVFRMHALVSLWLCGENVYVCVCEWVNEWRGSLDLRSLHSQLIITRHQRGRGSPPIATREPGLATVHQHNMCSLTHNVWSLARVRTLTHHHNNQIVRNLYTTHTHSERAGERDSSPWPIPCSYEQ